MYTYRTNKHNVIDDIMEMLYKNKDKLKPINEEDKISIAVDCVFNQDKDADNSYGDKIKIGYGNYHFQVDEDNQIEIKYFHNDKPISFPCGGGVDFFKTLLIYAENEDKFLQFYKNYTYHKKKKDLTKLNIYIPNKYGEWMIYNSIPKRSINSIYIDEKIKEKLITDIRNFISNEAEYDRFGIPYKRSYMLTGIPGSGKTSIIKAICNEIGHSLSILSLQKEFDNNSLWSAFRELEKNSILLIEDIDCIFEQRKTSGDNPLISFSSLINILDGVLYKHGIIIFITTNHPEKLDHALLRMGRIDMIIQFNYPREADIHKLFCDMNERQGCSSEIEETYKKFYDLIKNKSITMSAIVNFLFNYRMKCIENIKELIETNDFLTHLSGDDKKEVLYT